MRETDVATSVPGAGSMADRAEAFRRAAEGRLRDAYRLASAILGSPSDAADAVQDAFLIAWQRWPSLRDPARFDPWFRQIVVNVCRDRLRRSSRQRELVAKAQPELVMLDSSRQVHDRLLIETGLQRLKPDETIVLALRYYRDLKVDDIAEVLGVPAGTVKSRLNHAHQRLREVLGVEPEGTAR